MKEHSEQAPHQQMEAEISEIEERVERHEAAVAQHFDEIARVTRALEEEQAKKTALEQQLSDLRQQLSEEKARQATAKPSEQAGEETQEEKMQRHSQLIRDSDLFDAQWYLAIYPDVKADEKFSQTPHEHYLRHGGVEGRKPCPEFDSAYYLKQSPDVAEAGTNPLVHYLQYGRQEGRRIFPPFEETE